MGFRPKELTPNRSARHWFGAELRRCREAAGLSLDALSEVVAYDKSVLSRVETAALMIPERLPGLLDAAFGTDGHFQRVYGLARKEIHPDQFRRRMEMEARSRVLCQYSGQIVPGLLQTEEYARAQFRTHNPKATDEVIEELVMARMSRQALLSGDPAPNVSFILDEAVLRRSYGGSAVMLRQLARLEALTVSPNVVVQVLPFSHGGHALAGGMLALMTLDDGTHVAYEESISTGTLIEDADRVRSHQWAYDLLRACALSPADSAALIRSVMEALPHEHHSGPRPQPVGEVLVQRQWRRRLR